MISSPASQPDTANMTPAMAEWHEQLQLFGKVVFKQGMRRPIIAFGLIIISVIVGVALAVAEEQPDPQVLVGVTLFLVLIVGVPLIFYFGWFRKKTVVVETDGVRLTNGYLVPWDGIEHAGIWTYRGNTSVTLALEEDTMRAYQGQQSRAARWLTKANSALSKGSVVYLPSTLMADPQELAAWLNSLIEARHSHVDDRFTNAGAW